MRRSVWILFSLVILSALAACSHVSNSSNSPSPQGLIPVGSDFRDLYVTLGGEAELGPSISAPFTRNGALCQYTTNVLLCFNRSAISEADRHYVAPIGKQLNIQSLGPVVTGAPVIFEGFSEVYHSKFFGQRYVGLPLTSVRYNAEKRRLEQYFEKMGFYTLVDDPQKTVYLLAYGANICRENCDPVTPDRSIIGWNKGVEVLRPASLARLGGYGLFGEPASAPFLAKDGNLEQVLDKIVVYVPGDNSSTLKLRQAGRILYPIYNEPGPQRYSNKDNMIFYVVKGDAGFHVPTIFDQFIATHGSTEISGMPLSDPFEVTVDNQHLARQCFENYCLDYNPAAVESQRVSLASLGSAYLKSLNRDDLEVFKFSRKTVEFTAGEQYPQVSNEDNQTIQIMVRTRSKRLPISDIDSFVILGLPGGNKVSYNLPPTNLDGLSQVTIEPLSNIGNGVIIPYIVCLNVPSDEHICANESFLIWNSR
jgi:hypothetical protein